MFTRNTVNLSNPQKEKSSNESTQDEETHAPHVPRLGNPDRSEEKGLNLIRWRR